MEERPIPKLWEPEGGMDEPRERTEMRRGIDALNKKIDELSELYNRKLKTENIQDEVCVNSVIPESTSCPSNPTPAMTEMWEKMLRPFLEAQWNFYSSYNYGKGPHPPMEAPGVQYVKWGSKYTRDNTPRRGSWMEGVNRSPSSGRNWYDRNGPITNTQNRFQDARFGGYRAEQPKKRPRFNQWLQVE